MATVAERLNAKGPDFDWNLLELRMKAFPHLYTAEEIAENKVLIKEAKKAAKKK